MSSNLEADMTHINNVLQFFPSIKYTTSAIFVSFPQKRNGIVIRSGVNYLHSGGNIQSE